MTGREQQIIHSVSGQNLLNCSTNSMPISAQGIRPSNEKLKQKRGIYTLYKIPFLEIYIFRIDDQIQTNVNRKPTASFHTFLHFHTNLDSTTFLRKEFSLRKLSNYLSWQELSRQSLIVCLTDLFVVEKEFSLTKCMQGIVSFWLWHRTLSTFKRTVHACTPF